MEIPCHRVAKAILWFDPNNSRSRFVSECLYRQVVLVGLAAGHILEFLKPKIRIETDGDGGLKLVELTLPPRDNKTLTASRAMLDPNRPAAVAAREKLARRWVEHPPGPRERVEPRYYNAYRLTEIKTDSSGGHDLVFRLAEAFPYPFKRRDKKTGLEVAVTKMGLTAIDATVGFQRLITRFTPVELWKDVPVLLKNGLAQELAQELGSYIGLTNKGEQPTTSLPALGRLDPEAVRDNYLSGMSALAKSFPLGENGLPIAPIVPSLVVKFLPFRLVNSGDAPVLIREFLDKWRRCRLYVALPVAVLGLTSKEAAAAGLFWWHEKIGEFKPLSPWGGYELSGKRRPRPVFLVPLGFDGGRRRLPHYSDDLTSPEHGAFVQSLSDFSRSVCWSQIILRSGIGDDARPSFFLHLTTRHRVAVLRRPNLIGVWIGRERTDDQTQRTCLHWSAPSGQEQTGKGGGVIVVEELSLTAPWPGAAERRRLAREAARRLIRAAAELDADIAIGTVVKLKKRSGDGETNRLNTRFNHGDLITLIKQKGLDHAPAVSVVTEVSGFLLEGEPTPADKARKVADEGLKALERASRRRAAVLA